MDRPVLASGVVVFLFGLAVVTSPFLFLTHDRVDSAHQYRAAEVVLDGEEEIAFRDAKTGARRNVEGIDGVACIGSDTDRRRCDFERWLDASNATVEGGAPYGSAEYVYLEGQFYEANSTESGDERTLELAAVSPREALAGVAVPVDSARDPVQRAVEGETLLFRHEPHYANRVVQAGSEFYVVALTASYHRNPTWSNVCAEEVAETNDFCENDAYTTLGAPPIDPPLEGVLFVATGGLLSVLGSRTIRTARSN